GMKMTIGERTIIAQIKKRDDARRAYEDAKQQGQSASLLEQHRPNVFQMNVANILPSDIITVELKYTELLVPTDSVYSFIYPTVVGPRYTEKSAGTAPTYDRWTKNPYLRQGELPANTLSIDINLNAGLPIKDIGCRSHQVNIDYKGSDHALVKLKESEKHAGNKDFILKYRLAGNQIESGILLFDGKKENHFLLMLQPPKRVRTNEIPPREYIFIVDVSGSMHGFPLDISKKLLRNLIGNLRPTDRFNVLLFAGGSSVMADHSVAATSQNINHAINLIDRQRGGGGTQLLPALQQALSLPGTEDFSRSIVIATDGYVAVEEEAFDLIRNNLGNANMFTFGIGSSVNRHLIEGMARVGMGEPFVITKPDEADEKARDFRKLIQTPVLTNIEVDYGRFRAYDVEPISIPDVLAERPIIIFGKYRGKPKGTITVKGITGDRDFLKKIEVQSVSPSHNNAAIRYLWARHKIAILSDYNQLQPKDERTREVTSLGLTYNLLTAYTSFVAIDSQKRLHDGKAVTVKQPLPLPEGVSDSAVGNSRYALKSQAPLASPGLAFRRNGHSMEEAFESKKDISALPAETDKSASGKTGIFIDTVSVNKGLTAKTIKKQIESKLESINACYQKSLVNNVSVEVELSVVMIVDSTGKIKSVKIHKSKKQNKLLEQCIISNLKQLTFQKPDNGRTVKIDIKFSVK
ncbi:MAG: AgmX/PglI C-terminal domain-containing protein, partial [Desulfobacterales bacterium]|nr:AgmX/PglI C-terminal domain-containing protein [Desulfobacterales bacterium]